MISPKLSDFPNEGPENNEIITWETITQDCDASVLNHPRLSRMLESIQKRILPDGFIGREDKEAIRALLTKFANERSNIVGRIRLLAHTDKSLGGNAAAGTEKGNELMAQVTTNISQLIS